jgi:hypothetical protein
MKRELRLIYCRTVCPLVLVLSTRKYGQRFYRHPKAVGLYVWVREVQHHFRIEIVT